MAGTTPGTVEPTTAGGGRSWDLEAVAHTYDEFGWVTLPGFFDAAELAPMAARIGRGVDRVVAELYPIGGSPGGGQPLDRRLASVLAGRDSEQLPFSPFRHAEGEAGQETFELVTHSRLLTVLEALLGHSFTYDNAGLCRTILPSTTRPPSRNTKGFPLHQVCDPD